MTPRKEMPTADELRAVFNYDPATGVLSRKGGGRGGCIYGWKMPAGHLQFSYKNKKLLAHRIAWCIHYGQWPATEIDHANGDGADNRIVNLRLATRSQNCGNTKTRRNGLKGAYYDKSSGRWLASITKNRRQFHLGRFASEQEAHAAYCRAALETFGEFARI